MKKFINTLQEILYYKYDNALSKVISQVIQAMILRGSSSTSKIAMKLSQLNNLNFKSNKMKIYRLLRNAKFQIDDAFFRLHLSLIMRYLREKNMLRKGQIINLIIDFTSSKDNFLILYASMLTPVRQFPYFFHNEMLPKKSK